MRALVTELIKSTQALLALNFRTFVQQASSFDDAREVIGLLRPLSTDLELIRVGSAGDGGYLVPEKLASDCQALFSPGVADSMSFEEFFLERNVPCFLVDASISNPPIKHDLVVFEKLWLTSEQLDGDSTTLEAWVEKTGQKGRKLGLQMDIEGAEYEVLLGSSTETLKLFDWMVVEFHDLHASLSRSGAKLLRAAFQRILRTHIVIHFHVNNAGVLYTRNGLTLPSLVEVTLVRKDLISNHHGFADLPHPLDSRNGDGKAQFHVFS